MGGGAASKKALRLVHASLDSLKAPPAEPPWLSAVHKEVDSDQGGPTAMLDANRLEQGTAFFISAMLI